MFVYLPSRGKDAIAATLCALAFGCSDPNQSTDLRPDGPPEVLAVMVMNDAVNGLSEAATYCKPNDDKRPSLVGLPDGTTQQVCPLDGSGVTGGVTDAAQQGWFVRVVFDELLNADIEDLTEILDDSGMPTGTYTGSIARTHPFKLECTGVAGNMVEVPYDGYYSAAGNSLTWPLGPSLVVKPNVPASVPSNAKCQVTLNDNILDKNDGKQVPTDQRGPYAFTIGKIKVVSLSPSDGDAVDGVDAGMDIVFNTLVDPASIDDQAMWQFTPDLSTQPSLGVLDLALAANATTFTVNELAAPSNGNFEAGEPGCDLDAVTKAGPCDTELTIDGETMHLTAVNAAADPATYTVTRTAGVAHAAGAQVLAKVNNTLSIGFGPNGAQVGPAVGLPTIGGRPVGANEFLVIGDFKADTTYDFKIAAGTKLKDLCGVETTLGAPSKADKTEVSFKINPLKFSGITPIDGTTGALPGSKIQLKFNQPMNPDSLAGRCSTDATVQCFADAGCATGTCTGVKFTLTPAVTTLTVIQDLADSSKLDIYGDYQLATQYTFTLNAGVDIAECPGGETTSGAVLGIPNNGGGLLLSACETRNVKSFTNATAQTVKFTTASAIALTGSSPADNSSIVKPVTVGSSARNSIRLTFNQEMNPATLVQGPTGFDIDPSVPMSIGADAGNFRNIRLRAKTGCTTSATCTGLAAGSYTFTLHAGATIKDFLGNTYTQPSDLVIHFKISEPDPAPACIP